MNGKDTPACEGCGQEIGRSEARLNAGLCDACFQEACAAIARQVAVWTRQRAA